MDSPVVRRREFLNSSSFDEGGHGLFEYGSCGEGPHWGSLSLERDRLGGIVGGFPGHEGLLGRRVECRFAALDLTSFHGKTQLRTVRSTDTFTGIFSAVNQKDKFQWDFWITIIPCSSVRLRAL